MQSSINKSIHNNNTTSSSSLYKTNNTLQCHGLEDDLYDDFANEDLDAHQSIESKQNLGIRKNKLQDSNINLLSSFNLEIIEQNSNSVEPVQMKTSLDDVSNDAIIAFSHQQSLMANKQNVHKRKDKNNGLPDNLKHGIESLSGYSMDDVNVHYNSSKPGLINAHAFAQGTDIHLASGQEKHLPHEAWHVVQQKQGRVKPTLQMKGNVTLNNDEKLEEEADEMGAKAISTIQLKGNKFQKSPSNSNFHSIQRISFNSNSNNTAEVIQRAMISIGDVNRKTKLRERPKNDSPTRSDNIEVNKNVLKVDNPDKVIPDESGSKHNWLEVEVIAGEQIGYAGFLHHEKYRPAFKVDEKRLGYVTAKTKLRTEPTETKAGIDLKPGDIFGLIQNATDDVKFAKVIIWTGEGRNKTGWLREGKMMMRKDPLVPDTYEVEELTAAKERTAPELLGEAPATINDETSKETLLAALTDLRKKQQFFEYEIEQGGKPASSVAIAMEKVEAFFADIATAQQRLNKDDATAVAQQKAQTLANDLYFKLLDRTSKLKLDIASINTILNQDLSQSSLEQVEAELFLQQGRTKYKSALALYNNIKTEYDKLTSGITSTNPIIIETLAAAQNAAAPKKQEWEFGGQLLGYNSESIGDAVSEGGEASLSGLLGSRTTEGAHVTEDGRTDARIVSALDRYDKDGELEDPQKRQGYNSLDDGAIGLGSTGYKSFADSMSSVVQKSAKWIKDLGFLQDLSITPQGITATIDKLPIIKPFPPLASALISIPLYPGVGLKFEAKAKAAVSLSAGISINWGNWLTSGKKNQAELDALYQKQKTELGKKQLLQIKLRDGSAAEKEKAKEDYKAVGKQLQVLTSSIAKQQNQLSAWSRNMSLKVKGTGNANASIGGEFFGGIFLGIPVLNVSGGLYGEIGASAKASIGIDGTFERKDGDWYNSANLSFDLNGGLKAETGLKINYQIVFFSGDIAKFTIKEWNIASFYVRGNKGLGSKANPLTSPEGIEKKVMWFKGAPPIETRVEEGKDKAKESVKAVSDKIGDKLSTEQNANFEKVHAAVETGGAADRMAEKLASLKQKKSRLATMKKAESELPRGAIISGAKMAERARLEQEIRTLKASLAEARDAQNADMSELNKLLAVLEEKHGSKFSTKRTLSESAEKEVGSFRTLSDTYFNEAQKKTFALSRKLRIAKVNFDEAKAGLDAFLALNHASVKEYTDLETLVHKKEEAIGTQKQAIKELELQKSEIKNQKKKSSEAERDKQNTIKTIDSKLTEEKIKLKTHERVLDTLKEQKTKARKNDKTNVEKYKTFRDALRIAKNQYENIIEEMERINTQMLKARSFAEEADVLDAQLKEYSRKIAEVNKYKNLMEELKNVESL